MFAETVSIIVPSSVLAAINSWLTPTVFFVILNAVIAAIAFTSSLANQKPQSHPDSSSTPSSATPKVPRSPSVLQRLRSVNFPAFRSPEPALKPNPDFEPDSAHNPQTLIQTASYIFRQDYLPETEAQIVSREESVDPILTRDEKPEPIRSRFDLQAAIEEEAEESGGLDGGSRKAEDSDAKPLTGEIPARVPARMTKSASVKAACSDSEEADVEARRPATMKERVTTEADEEVDAKADDFINKFRQQLELQRADSILRYKGVNRRGAER